ncbi:hypothetical protein BDV59DRAFT_193822 [Aspergillus ambiguus]|uniref:uncharacterized protein n=1 Tax=Aspergillus ambiguus TaxID=176160 RepID=UPI003CCDFA60
MKAAPVPTLISALLLGLGTTKAQSTAHITFIGAGGAQFTRDIPTSGNLVDISDPLSVSQISSSTAGVACTFNGIDHGITTLTEPGTVDVGPPQTQLQGACRVGTVPPSHPIQPQPSGGQVLITFIGAANAQFDQSFPTNGANTPITNPLSISHIMSNTGGVRCTFNGKDHSITSLDGAETVDVGPPQAQVSGECRAV